MNSFVLRFFSHIGNYLVNHALFQKLACFFLDDFLYFLSGFVAQRPNELVTAGYGRVFSPKLAKLNFIAPILKL